VRCPVPDVIADVQVTRAWSAEPPRGGRGGSLRFEGHDELGRVRAGTLTAGRADLLPPGVDPRLPDLAGWSSTADVVVHRAGRRAVLRTAEGYVKVVRPGRGPDLAARAGQGRHRAAEAGLAAPEVLCSGPGWMAMSTVAGQDLHRAAATVDRTQWLAWWRQWAQAWPDLVASDPTGLPAHTGTDEAGVLWEAVSTALAWRALPDRDGAGMAVTEQVCRGLAAAPDPATGVGHRDLHDKQLLGGTGPLGVLDFDTAAVTEPALDLANLAVHARWRTVQGVWSPEQADVVVEAARQVAHTLAVPSWRWESYAAGTALRLAAVYAFRPRWHDAAVRWWDEEVGRAG
jgi:aminoglycoside phosphotransferase (APT) family kinase protein